MRDDLPTGTVTFLFTDVEGSTKLLHELGAEAYAEALAEHRSIVRVACAAENGVEVDTQGDAFFFAFASASAAVTAARAMTEALAVGPIELRIGLHTGTPLVTAEGYVGDDVHLAARVAASAHGGQVVLSQATGALLDGHSLSDLGEHRLKDIDGAVAIFQLGDTRFPPLKTISNTNLPRPASSFIGRTAELANVLSLVEDGSPLVTLTGPGGSGKTRLALEAAASLVPSYKAGVFWIALASLRDPSLVAETISQTLGARDGLAEHIAERELLLLVDNFEHVVSAAPELSALLTVCPNLTLLVTSRELLRVQGEVEYEVPPLASPEAVSLFCARSRLEPDEQIAELCARLDDLPLAIELAAARTKALTPAQILARLAQRLDLLEGGRDADPRQQTLRATIDWSYDLLSEPEQRLFRALSIFAGGCSLETAGEVCAAELDIVQSLVEKNLLRFSNERYWMLETIREYASECLEAWGEGELRRRHAEHFLALAEEAYPHLTGSPKAWLERLEAEHDNIRAALDRLESAGETQLVLRLAGALWKFWYQAGYHSEGLHRLERALAGDENATAARALALSGASAIAGEAGDAVLARRSVEEALALYRQLGDAGGVANAIYLHGNLAAAQREWASARAHFEVSLQAFRELGDEHYTLLSMGMLAWMRDELGDLNQGRALWEDMLSRARALGNQRIEAYALNGLTFHAREAGRFDEALSLLGDAYRIHRDLGQRSEIARTISLLARVHAAAGELVSAVQLLASSDAHFDELGESPPTLVADTNEETLAIAHAQLDEGAFTAAWEEGRTLTADAAVALALAARE